MRTFAIRSLQLVILTELVWIAGLFILGLREAIG